MNIHYLEIVSRDVDGVCATYERLHGVEFSKPEPALGNARTATLPNGRRVGVRAPMHEAEQPIVRPYLLVDDIQTATAAAVECGAEIAHPPLEIAGLGTFAIFIQGGVHHGLWQL
jgi:predicted enzyme related to lactoylglutathione lyase